jgi:hypothetical protein
MRTWLRKQWPAIKVLFTAAVLFFICRQLVRDLGRPELEKPSLHLGWLGLAGVLYLAGLGFSAFFWYHLLKMVGQRPEIMRSVRAYYIGHLGKYLPGKAWALVQRATLAQSPGVTAGVAGMTAFYEVLTTMASGALLAAILLSILGPDSPAPVKWSLLWGLFAGDRPDANLLDRMILVGLALVLLALVGVPILPPLFNRLVRRLSLPFQEPGTASVHLPLGALAEGLALTICGWLFLGASLWAVMQSVATETLPLTWQTSGRYSAFLSLAYVLGFAVLLAPGGLGIRETFLYLFLTPEMRCQPGLTGIDPWVPVVLLRVVWTVAELIVAVCLYRFGSPAAAGAAPERKVAP